MGFRCMMKWSFTKKKMQNKGMHSFAEFWNKFFVEDSVVTDWSHTQTKSMRMHAICYIIPNSITPEIYQNTFDIYTFKWKKNMENANIF